MKAFFTHPTKPARSKQHRRHLPALAEALESRLLFAIAQDIGFWRPSTSQYYLDYGNLGGTQNTESINLTGVTPFAAGINGNT
jgi:hypothetical protein